MPKSALEMRFEDIFDILVHNFVHRKITFSIENRIFDGYQPLYIWPLKSPTRSLKSDFLEFFRTYDKLEEQLRMI